jgi:predicted nucleic-acid-binding protein
VIVIDLNVLVRYIAHDDPAQSKKATTLIERECSEASPGFVGLVVLVEVVWVAESCYQASREDVARIVRQILGSRQLVVQDAETVWQALRLFQQSCRWTYRTKRLRRRLHPNRHLRQGRRQVGHEPARVIRPDRSKCAVHGMAEASANRRSVLLCCAKKRHGAAVQQLN